MGEWCAEYDRLHALSCESEFEDGECETEIPAIELTVTSGTGGTTEPAPAVYTLQKNENCIIITHHMPSESLIDIKYKTKQMLPYNQWFYCNMDNLIETKKDKIKCWIYGHTHTPSNVIINEIPFLCNPIGYPNENSILDLDKNFTIGCLK